MTREEAQEEMEVGANPNEVVDAIYDDFESRTCENCKHFNDDGECVYLDMLPDAGFGCNQFERKG